MNVRIADNKRRNVVAVAVTLKLLFYSSILNVASLYLGIPQIKKPAIFFV